MRIEGGWERGVTSLTHMQVYSHQVPGGMISNLESQLTEQNALDRLPEVLEEIPVVRAEVGFPPLVTPMSQIVGTQAVLNVLSGKRWHIVPDEMKAYLRGRYGAAPGPVSTEIVERVLGDERPITVRPAELVDETLDDSAPRWATWRTPTRTSCRMRSFRRQHAPTSNGTAWAPSTTSSARRCRPT